MDIIQKEDSRFFIERPDSSFSPQRNKAIINETIQETTKYFRDLEEKIDDDMRNRIDILSSYATYRLSGTGTKSFKDYVGKELRSRLIGEKILSKIKVLESADRLKGRTKILL